MEIDITQKLYERLPEIMDKFKIKLEDRKKLLFECGLPKKHFVKFGEVPVNHPQSVLMNILRKYEDFGISINAKMKIKIKNEFYELVNEKYTGYPNVDKTILPKNIYKKNDDDKAREKIEDFLRDNVEFFIDEFIKQKVELQDTDLVLWNKVNHNDPEQIKRQKYARDENRLITKSVNRKLKSGIFEGTSHTYKTFLDNCSCEDFQQRKLPCKHIYRLAYELGIIQRPMKKVPPGIPKADKEIKGIAPGRIFHIEYKGSNGDVSERDIEIQKLAYVGDKLYIYAYCHLRHMVRSFLASGIISMTYEGRQINNFNDLLNIDGNVVENLVKQAMEN